MDDEPTVAIACQGGGSHTAFTAGVLKRLLPAVEDRLVGLSGTSGGAISAVAGWYGLLAPEEDPVDLLDAVWADVAAESATERLANDLFVWGRRVEASGVPVPEVSPYHVPASAWGQRQLRRILERHVDFDRLAALVDEASPRLFVGTVDVNGGEFETFDDEDVTVEALLASTAVPDVFQAVELDGHWHWDGLFSQNPPIHELMTLASDEPEELWVVQINPQTREGRPTSLLEIADRRNELAGNLSLNQELRFVETVNDWIDAGHLPEGEYVRTNVRRIELGLELDSATKFDRSPEFVEELIELGERRAEAFLGDLPDTNR